MFSSYLKESLILGFDILNLFKFVFKVPKGFQACANSNNNMGCQLSSGSQELGWL
jgi:hypothetical protein